MIDLSKIDLGSISYPFENARVRSILKKDSEEQRRLWEIETDPLVVNFIENQAKSPEEVLRQVRLRPDYLMVAVEGKAGYVASDEVGKLQGWVTVYEDEKKRLQRLLTRSLLEEACGILEVGFARHPQAKPGQMASALRQVLHFLGQVHKKAGQRLLVTAYTDKENEASVRVLTAAGFVCRGQIKYHIKDKAENHFFILDWEALAGKLRRPGGFTNGHDCG